MLARMAGMLLDFHAKMPCHEPETDIIQIYARSAGTASEGEKWTGAMTEWPNCMTIPPCPGKYPVKMSLALYDDEAPTHDWEDWVGPVTGVLRRLRRNVRRHWRDYLRLQGACGGCGGIVHSWLASLSHPLFAPSLVLRAPNAMQ